MRNAINFNISEEESDDQTRHPPNPDLESSLTEFHEQLMNHCRLFEEELETDGGEEESPGLISRLLGLEKGGKNADGEGETPEEPPGGYFFCVRRCCIYIQM